MRRDEERRAGRGEPGYTRLEEQEHAGSEAPGSGHSEQDGCSGQHENVRGTCLAEV